VTLFDAHGQIIQEADIHDPQDVSALDAELLRCMAAELDALEHEGEPLLIELSPLVAVQLAGLIQLALRHPLMNLRDVGLEVLETVREYFAECPAVREVLRRGDDPGQDVPT
jgi:hypothetical protein